MTPPADGRRAAAGWNAVAGFVLVAVVLEVAVMATGTDPGRVPPPSTVVATAAQLVIDPTFIGHVATSVVAMLTGLMAAMLIAVPLGLALGRMPLLGPAGLAVADLLRPIPSVATVPIAVLVLGRGIDMKALVICYAAAWPILIHAAAGARSVDRVALETSRVYAVRGIRLLRSVLLPAAAPHIATGVRVAIGVAFAVVVSAEFIAGGSRGIGIWLLGATQAGQPRELLFAGILVTGVVGIGLDALGRWAERRTFGWDASAEVV